MQLHWSEVELQYMKLLLEFVLVLGATRSLTWKRSTTRAFGGDAIGSDAKKKCTGQRFVSLCNGLAIGGEKERHFFSSAHYEGKPTADQSVFSSEKRP